MKRFFTDIIEDSVILTSDEHNHLSRVLRLGVGEEVVVCNGDGYDYVCVVERMDKRQTELRLKTKIKNECDPIKRLTVFSALTKGDKPELIAQKLTELGVSAIRFVTTEYTVAKPSPARMERVARICAEAAKQCGRASLPNLDEGTFSQMIAALKDYDLIIFPYEKAVECSLKQFLDRVDVEAVKNAALIVGSEGGFSDEEAAQIAKAGGVPLTLGKRILRAETANIAVAGIVLNALGEYR